MTEDTAAAVAAAFRALLTIVAPLGDYTGQRARAVGTYADAVRADERAKVTAEYAAAFHEIVEHAEVPAHEMAFTPDVHFGWIARRARAALDALHEQGGQ